MTRVNKVDEEDAVMLKRDMEVRWNSTFTMLDSVRRGSLVLDEMFREGAISSIPDSGIISDLCLLLQPVKVVSKYFERPGIVNISKIPKKRFRL